jgi:hypothetical protein
MDDKLVVRCDYCKAILRRFGRQCLPPDFFTRVASSCHALDVLDRIHGPHACGQGPEKPTVHADKETAK